MEQVTNERKIFAKLIKQDLNSKIPQLINISEGGGLGLSQIYCLLLHSEFDRALFNFRFSLKP